MKNQFTISGGYQWSSKNAKLAIQQVSDDLIKRFDGKKGEPLPKNIPTDLHGYFISEYTINSKGQVIFNDNGSLRMSIESDVKEYFNQITTNFNPINETD